MSERISLLIIAALLAVILFFVIRSGMKGTVKTLLSSILLAVMIILVIRFVSSTIPKGSFSNVASVDPVAVETMKQESSVNPENCIILRGDQILIDDHPVDMDFVKGYVEERIDTNTVITIVDDYSTSSLHHEVTELCEEKGMKPENMTYEEWAEQ